MNTSCSDFYDSDVYQSRVTKLWLKSYQYNTYQDQSNDIDQVSSPVYIFRIISLLASVVCLIIGFTMLYNRKFDKHPYKLIAWQLLAVAGATSNFKP